MDPELDIWHYVFFWFWYVNTRVLGKSSLINCNLSQESTSLNLPVKSGFVHRPPIDPKTYFCEWEVGIITEITYTHPLKKITCRHGNAMMSYSSMRRVLAGAGFFNLLPNQSLMGFSVNALYPTPVPLLPLVGLICVDWNDNSFVFK